MSKTFDTKESRVTLKRSNAVPNIPEQSIRPVSVGVPLKCSESIININQLFNESSQELATEPRTVPPSIQSISKSNSSYIRNVSRFHRTKIIYNVETPDKKQTYLNDSDETDYKTAYKDSMYSSKYQAKSIRSTLRSENKDEPSESQFSESSKQSGWTEETGAGDITRTEIIPIAMAEIDKDSQASSSAQESKERANKSKSRSRPNLQRKPYPERKPSQSQPKHKKSVKTPETIISEKDSQGETVKSSSEYDKSEEATNSKSEKKSSPKSTEESENKSTPKSTEESENKRTLKSTEESVVTKPLITMTDKGAIRFQLPGRIQHKTTIKLAHYPENCNENVVINIPNENGDSGNNGGGESCGIDSGRAPDQGPSQFPMGLPQFGMNPGMQQQQPNLPFDPYSMFCNGQNYCIQPQQAYQGQQQQQGQQFMQQMQMQQNMGNYGYGNGCMGNMNYSSLNNGSMDINYPSANGYNNCYSYPQQSYNPYSYGYPPC